MTKPSSTALGEVWLKALRNALIEGEQSGKLRPFDFEEFKARKCAKITQANS